MYWLTYTDLFLLLIDLFNLTKIVTGGAEAATGGVL